MGGKIMKAFEAIVIPIFVPVGGSPGWAKPPKPEYPNQPRRDEPHHRDQPIPASDRDRLRRDVEAFRKATRPQVDAVVAAARALLSP
jgi:hypothetical protein